MQVINQLSDKSAWYSDDTFQKKVIQKSYRYAWFKLISSKTSREDFDWKSICVTSFQYIY